MCLSTTHSVDSSSSPPPTLMPCSTSVPPRGVWASPASRTKLTSGNGPSLDGCRNVAGSRPLQSTVYSTGRPLPRADYSSSLNRGTSLDPTPLLRSGAAVSELWARTRLSTSPQHGGMLSIPSSDRSLPSAATTSHFSGHYAIST